MYAYDTQKLPPAPIHFTVQERIAMFTFHFGILNIPLYDYLHNVPKQSNYCIPS
jgi:hypothetical protein